MHESRVNLLASIGTKPRLESVVCMPDTCAGSPLFNDIIYA